jgi:PhoPQ-activated pathogenicity-related protein
VDPRVVAIAPIVIDVLNLGPSLVHHWETYGFWAPAIKEYSDIGLQNWHGTPEYAKLLKIEDPWEYRQRLTIPKFIINSAGDQFFPPDSSRFYFDDLPGQKFLRYVPNTDHSLKKSDAWMTLLACYEAILHQSDLPSFKWTTMADGSLDVDCKTAPTKALLWSATNETARDFRLESFGAKWTSSELAAAAATPGKYTATVTKPKAGWTAWFVELTFPSGRTSPWKFTTSVQMNPDTFAHKFSPPKK